MNIFRNMRLKPSILTSFVVLTVPVFFTIIAVTYFSNDRIARASAQGLVERFRNEAIDNIQDDFTPIKSLVRSAAAIGDEFPDFYASSRCFKYFQTILVHSPKIVSVYVGLEDGSFRQTRRVDAEVKIQDKPAASRRPLCLPLDHAQGRRADVRSFPLSRRRPEGAGLERPAHGLRSADRGCGIAAPSEARTEMISDPDVFATLGPDRIHGGRALLLQRQVCRASPRST